MSEQGFKRRDVEHSFRAFKDLVDDLTIATSGTWSDVFTRLVHHCLHNRVMKVVTKSLRNEPSPAIVQWCNDCIQKGVVRLPTDERERLSRLFGLLVAVYHGVVDKSAEFDLLKFCWEALSTGMSYDEALSGFTEQIVVPFARDLGYRLDDILEDAREEDENNVPFQVIYQHLGPSIQIGGSADSASISLSAGDITVTQISTIDEIRGELATLRGFIQQLSLEKEEGSAALADFRVLEEAAEGKGSQQDVERAAGQLAKRHSGIKSWLQTFLSKATVSLASNLLVQALKGALAG